VADEHRRQRHTGTKDGLSGRITLLSGLAGSRHRLGKITGDASVPR